jgi:site-specific recombinase XerD
VDLAEKTLRVRNTKFCKERLVPLGAVASFYLKKYLHEVRPQWGKNPAQESLFLNDRGIPLCPIELYDIVKKYAERAGIQKKVSPHIIRHTCATLMLEGGADIFSIKEQLGHRKVETTQGYAKVSPSNLKNIHRNCHPRGKNEGPSIIVKKNATIKTEITHNDYTNDSRDRFPFGPNKEIKKSVLLKKRLQASMVSSIA